MRAVGLSNPRSFTPLCAYCILNFALTPPRALGNKCCRQTNRDKYFPFIQCDYPLLINKTPVWLESHHALRPRECIEPTVEASEAIVVVKLTKDDSLMFVCANHCFELTANDALRTDDQLKPKLPILR